MVVQSTNHHAKKYKNLLPSIYALFRQEGVLNLYTGLGAASSLLFYVSASILERSKLYAFQLLFQSYTNAEDAVALALIADSVWDITYHLITMPLQTIQRRIQCQMPVEEPLEAITPLSKHRFYSIWDCAKKLIEENNGSWWNAFYRGFTSKLLLISSAKALRLLTQIALVEDDGEEEEY